MAPLLPGEGHPPPRDWRSASGQAADAYFKTLRDALQHGTRTELFSTGGRFRCQHPEAIALLRPVLRPAHFKPLYTPLSGRPDDPAVGRFRC